ncbi:MAG: Stp1/IreP family PP2C-type Ser/Thr phosphatase [Candidatus Aminicenantes bacterium]|nr:Stp1/IreP family PP2C-type Ser/Thr phosphatase [Candidatus Aminicenantes bacterium]
MKINYSGQTDKGRVRKANEDFLAYEKISENEYLFIVADGMGGHQAGDVASKLGTQAFVSAYKSLRGNDDTISETMQQSIKEANTTILAKASADLSKKGMGTTFSAMVISDMKAHIVHVGDSRIYLIRDNRIHKITTDHTFVEKMMEEGRLSEEEARNHPQKNILYMSLGARESFAPVLIEDYEVREGDLFILCSDGLNNMVSDEQILEFSFKHPSPTEMVAALIDQANEQGGTDNITVQAIEIGSKNNSGETEPINIVKRKGAVFALSFIALLIILFIIYLVFK